MYVFFFINEFMVSHVYFSCFLVVIFLGSYMYHAMIGILFCICLFYILSFPPIFSFLLHVLYTFTRIFHTGWASRTYYSDNGSTAIEIALKMAFRKFSSDHGILSNLLNDDSAERCTQLMVIIIILDQITFASC